MSDITRVLGQIENGDGQAAEELLPLVYDELRRLAAAKMAAERPGQTLQATALVHEAYLRLTDTDQPQQWDSKGHFFTAAAEAMRRILVESARRKNRRNHGGERTRIDLADPPAESGMSAHELLELNDALDVLAEHDHPAATLVELRVFAGLTIEEAAAALGLSRTTAYRRWTYAKAWLFSRMRSDDST